MTFPEDMDGETKEVLSGLVVDAMTDTEQRDEVLDAVPRNDTCDMKCVVPPNNAYVYLDSEDRLCALIRFGEGYGYIGWLGCAIRCLEGDVAPFIT